MTRQSLIYGLTSIRHSPALRRTMHNSPQTSLRVSATRVQPQHNLCSVNRTAFEAPDVRNVPLSNRGHRSRSGGVCHRWLPRVKAYPPLSAVASYRSNGGFEDAVYQRSAGPWSYDVPALRRANAVPADSKLETGKHTSTRLLRAKTTHYKNCPVHISDGITNWMTQLTTGTA